MELLEQVVNLEMKGCICLSNSSGRRINVYTKHFPSKNELIRVIIIIYVAILQKRENNSMH